jgi:two-component system chemotaxis response regulator CheY
MPQMPIVVIDDDDDIRGAIQEVLQAEGYATAGAANGEEAIRLIRGTEGRPSLILLDLMMPVMDGWEFLKELDDEPKLRGTPVAIMSAHPSIRRAFEEGRRRGGSTDLLLHGSKLMLLPKPLTVLRLLAIAREVSLGAAPSAPSKRVDRGRPASPGRRSSTPPSVPI